ncbi:hypothetical protein HBI70_235650 [Parastagonospora nodorum]|nr:hypothetical protein HBH53_096070 [Parastagonospora nodorum]KAH4607928.1 hypothetical protein HBH82_087200 [Parastagonospora nodorum]KAH4696439.1 hypothetical protein HBH78_064270 [Parastagonospora nodorum]KAH4709596.1 hypothetical protein HBH67_051190 [Parastagonospora nodorum]KAH4782875.1 hypothetical protein HBH62_106380 [Parastagonospora nodorum]
MKDQIITRQDLTHQLAALQEATTDRPYSIPHRLELAKVYKQLGYPDLAASDAYKALLLIDEVVEEGEYHEEAIEAARDDYISEVLAQLSVEEENESKEEEGAVTWAQTVCSITAYDILIGCLLDCGSYRSAFDYIARAQKAFPENTIFQKHDGDLSSKISKFFAAKSWDMKDVEIDDYPERGLVRREQYPWNHHEPDRSSEECLDFLNGEMAGIAPKLEVKITELPLLSTETSEASQIKQLGVFAKEDIPPGERILEEKSLLTSISRLHDHYCDACSLQLPTTQDTSAGGHDEIVSCDECNVVFFCSMECHDLAQDSYHPSLCGVSVEQGKVSASEAADALYTSLLVRALALAETQGLHPLELKEIRYIWGDYHGQDLDKIWKANADGQLTDAFAGIPQTLPFSFKSNVLAPLHMLENMEVNIFTQSNRYDTWVFNTIFAKLRGTASARQGLDGRPETGAVHPMWCLANHSCDPNVAWAWDGSMRLWTRENLVEWKGRDPSTQPGIKKGEEVFSHYCDVRLPVKERREWAAGALGGACVCPRCIWEDQKSRIVTSTQ